MHSMAERRHAVSPKGRRRFAAASAARLLLAVLACGALVTRLGNGTSSSSFGMGLKLSVPPPQQPRKVHTLSGMENAELLAAAEAIPSGELAPAKLAVGAAWYAGPDRTLSFPPCGGFAAQRAAIVSGVVLAAELNRTLVLPTLLPLNDSGGSLPFGKLYDAPAFVSGIRGAGLPSIPNPPDPASTTQVRLDRRVDYMLALTDIAAHHQHIRVDCPLSKVPPDLLAQHEELVFAALQALQPAPHLQAVVAREEQALQGLAAAQAFNVLHLRADQDWVEQCALWEGIADGIARDNCLNNTGAVGDQLKLHNVDGQVPLLLVTSGSKAGSALYQQALANLESNGYQVVHRHGLAAPDAQPAELSADEAMLVEYTLAQRARQFAGNSVSAFTALLIMERWRANRYALYYNGGNIPLEALLPHFPMPWVFTYNDWSAGTEYEHMVKAAVASGIRAARMKPFCMYSGSDTSDMYRWLVGMGVRIIRHTPAWKEALAQEGRRHREEYSQLYSHLYKSDGALLGAFQRIDIPILRELDQYNYVLFTDCDVFFRKQMKLWDWGTPLPTALGLGFENEDKFPYNDGVMLWNMPYMRRTNAAFVGWILNQTNGLYFPGYGPVDQGAFNQYYENEIKGKPINKDFNAKMYHALRKSARIVHFHGPKPNHYSEWFVTQKCAGFQDMCKNAYIKGGLCPYAIEYGTQWASDWPEARRLAHRCINMLAGSFHPYWEDPLYNPCQEQQKQEQQQQKQQKQQKQEQHNGKQGAQEGHTLAAEAGTPPPPPPPPPEQQDVTTAKGGSADASDVASTASFAAGGEAAETNDAATTVIAAASGEAADANDAGGTDTATAGSGASSTSSVASGGDGSAASGGTHNTSSTAAADGSTLTVTSTATTAGATVTGNSSSSTIEIGGAGSMSTQTDAATVVNAAAAQQQAAQDVVSDGSSAGDGFTPPPPPVPGGAQQAGSGRLVVKPLEAAVDQIDVAALLKPRDTTTQA